VHHAAIIVGRRGGGLSFFISPGRNSGEQEEEEEEEAGTRSETENKKKTESEREREREREREGTKADKSSWRKATAIFR